MKTFYKLFTLLLVISSTACSSSQKAQTYDDDIYYSPGDAPAKAETPAPNRLDEGAPAQNNNEDYGSEGDYYDENARTGDVQTEQYTDGSGNTYITNNFNGSNNTFNYDDYYDYAYAARIRRFHQPVVIASYYDAYYTNAYWYTYDPFLWGTSIYTGYSWWRPRPWAGWGCNYSWNWGWDCGWSFGMGYGWGNPYPYYG